MAFTSLQAQTYSALLNESLKNTLVFGSVCNNNYQGDLTGKNRSVVINQIGNVTITDYASAGSVVPEKVSATSLTLVADQEKAFSVAIPRALSAESSVDIMSGVMTQAAYGIGNVVDTYIAGFTAGVTNSACLYGTSASAITIASSSVDTTNVKIYDAIVKLATILDKNNAPKSDRFVVLPPDMLSLLSLDSRFTLTYPTILQNGLVDGQKVAGMSIFSSNNVPLSSGKYSILAGSKNGITLAYGLQHIELFSPEQYFDQAVKGLYVFGAKMISELSLAVGTFKL